MRYFIFAVSGLSFTAGFGYLAFHGDGGFGSFLWGCCAFVAMFITMTALAGSTETGAEREAAQESDDE